MKKPQIFPAAMFALLMLLTSLATADEASQGPAIPATDTPAIDATETSPEAAASESTEATEPADEEIAELIKQLDDDKFALRRQASKRLGEIGKPAIDAIAEATKSPSLEVKSRAFDLLEKFFEKGDDSTQAAAKRALEKLAAGNGDVAARAEAVLTPMEDVAGEPGLQPNQGGIQIVPGGPIQIGNGGRIQIGGRIRVVGGGLKIKVANNNGNKEIEVEENGRKVKINEDAGGKIKMEVTEKKGDKEETKKYEADSAEELKKNDPEAYKIYDKYSKQNNIQINGRAIQIFQGGQIQPGQPIPLPQGIPVLPQFAPNQQGNLPPNIQQQQIEAQKRMVEALEKMKAMQQQKLGNQAPKIMDERIKRIQQQIERMEQQLQIVDPLPEAKPAEEAPEAEQPANE